jgi:N-sulfoglucosamine sulfohydrolase
VLDAAGLPPADGVDGVSFVPLLKGGTQAGRDKVFTQIDSKAGGGAVPMRCVQDKKFGYMYNMWSDGEFEYHNNNEGQTMKAMVEAAENDPAIAERVRMFRIRVPEEFYDLEKDPSCLHNLIDDPEYKTALDKMRTTLAGHMKDSNDPALKAFENRHDRETVKAVFADVYPGKVAKKTKDAQGKKNNQKKKKK